MKTVGYPGSIFASALAKLSGVAFMIVMASSSGLYAADDPHAHHNHEVPSISDNPHAGHDMTSMESKNPHEGHDMSSMDSNDPHAGHDMTSMDPDDPHAHHRAALEKKSNMAMINLELPEGLSMINQYGENVDLRSDVIDDKVVVINFIYTTCETICPVISSIMTMVQKELGDDMNKDVALVTITVDPARDTSHRLLSYSERYNPQEGWSWLTGDKRMVDKVNTILGSYTVSFEDHPAMILIGDSSKSEWYRYYGFPPPADISTKVKDLLNNRAG